MVHRLFSTGFLKMFALVIGYFFKKMPWLWGYVFKVLPWLWVHPLNSHRHMYTRPPIGVTPSPPRLLLLATSTSQGILSEGQITL